MRVASAGFAAVKGTRYVVRDGVELGRRHGPVGDREFCLVDPASAAVLRTIAHPALLAVAASWDGVRLGFSLPGSAEVVAEPVGGASVAGEYWGRPAELTLVEGPWAAALGDYLGRPVAVARIARPGAVVYGASVSIVTTTSLRAAGELLGVPVDQRRFRSTLVVDTDADAPFAEDAWAGRRLTMGDAEVAVMGGIPRCGVIDLDPDTGVRDRPLFRALTDAGITTFGVDAVVTRPGWVAPGAPVRLVTGT